MNDDKMKRKFCVYIQLNGKFTVFQFTTNNGC